MELQRALKILAYLFFIQKESNYISGSDGAVKRQLGLSLALAF